MRLGGPLYPLPPTTDSNILPTTLNHKLPNVTTTQQQCQRHPRRSFGARHVWCRVCTASILPPYNTTQPTPIHPTVLHVDFHPSFQRCIVFTPNTSKLSWYSSRTRNGVRRPHRVSVPHAPVIFCTFSPASGTRQELPQGACTNGVEYATFHPCSIVPCKADSP